MAIHHYAILNKDRTEIVNIAAIDTENVDSYMLDRENNKVTPIPDPLPDDHNGTHEPWGHDMAQEAGYVYLCPTPPGPGWVTTDGGKTFHHPDNPNQSFMAHLPPTDDPTFPQPNRDRAWAVLRGEGVEPRPSAIEGV